MNEPNKENGSGRSANRAVTPSSILLMSVAGVRGDKQVNHEPVADEEETSRELVQTMNRKLKAMAEGKLYKRCIELRKTFCVHAPEEDEDGNITQKVHDAYRKPDEEEIKQSLDDARKEMLSRHSLPTIKRLEKWEKWFKEQFGE